jgi:hypothetical protein
MPCQPWARAGRRGGGRHGAHRVEPPLPADGVGQGQTVDIPSSSDRPADMTRVAFNLHDALTRWQTGPFFLLVAATLIAVAGRARR